MGDFMSSVVLSGDTSGTVSVTVPAVAGTNTVTIPAVTGTAVIAGQNSAITAGTAQASTSGTSIDFTSIPSWVKRITVMLNGVSVSGTSQLLTQIGSGSVETSGYSSSSGKVNNSAVCTSVSSTAGYIAAIDPAAASLTWGQIVLTLISGNTWIYSVNGGCSGNTVGYFGGGTKTTSGTLDRVRITTVNGTDTFDAGSINILYE